MGLRDVVRGRLRRESPAVSAVPGGLDLAAGERLLASAAVDGGVLAVTTRRLVAPGVPAGGMPWHLVDTGGWDRGGDGRLHVSWVDGTEAASWHLADPGRVPEAFRERVQASVVLAEQVSLDQTRRARVVLRKDLTSGRFLAQTIVGRGCDPDDPELVAETERVALSLAEQVGLDP